MAGYKRKFGCVHEEPFVYPFMGGREYLELCGRLRCMPEKVLGGKKAAFLFAVVPMAVSALPLFVWLWGWMAGSTQVLYAAVLAWLQMETLLVGSERRPFTRSDVPGKANLKASWPFHILGYVLCVSAFSALDLWIPEGFQFVYDGRPDLAVRTLELIQ